MRLLLLFLLMVSAASSTIYWKNQVQQPTDIIRYHVALMMDAIKNNNTGLLYQLTPIGERFDSFHKSYLVLNMSVEKARAIPSGEIEGLGTVWAALVYPRQQPEPFSSIFTLTPSASSPTGFVLTKMMFCEGGCYLQV
uniref:Secreted protein n=1 Tax=Caenorhabditis tropicalis TaxID=1561998 RepID=A0A1I7URS0_9PELO